MTSSEREQAALFRLIRDCEAPGTFAGERFLENLERHLGLRHTVYYTGGASLAAASEHPLAVRGRAAPMLPAYVGRYHRHDAFRTATVDRLLAARGIADLRQLPRELVARHREYVDEFHGRFGTRTITVVKLDGGQRAGYLFVLNFESDVPRREVGLLHSVRGLLALQFERDRRPLDVAVERLTGKEKRIAELVAHGLSNAQIAYSLDIKVDTVKKYLTSIYAICGVRSRTQLALAVRA